MVSISLSSDGNTSPSITKGGVPPGDGGGGQTLWELAQRSLFHGQRIPLGDAGTFKPSETRARDDHTMQGTSMYGIFAGHEMCHGYQWAGVYNVWPLLGFADADLSTFTRSMHSRPRFPHVVKVVELPPQGIWYPLGGMSESIIRWRSD